MAPASFPQVYSPHHTLHLFQRIYFYHQLGALLQEQALEAEQKGDGEKAERLHREAEPALSQARELDLLG